MRYSLLLLLVGSLALVFGPGDGLTQFRQRGGAGGQPRQMGGFSFDPGQIFDRVANGKTEIVVAEVTDFRAKGMLDQVVTASSITNGIVTRDQFVQGWPKAMEAMRAQWSGGGRGGFGRPTAGGPTPAPTTGQPASGAADTNQWDQEAEADFKRRDRNGDGFLSEDEMNRSFAAEWRQWDANKDGKIDMTEYKGYYRARMAARAQGPAGGPIILPPETAEIEEKKPIVYRAGKMPKGFDWFEKLDSDKDGQIGLYEWVKAGRDIEEFVTADRNQDGFLTIQEALRAIEKKQLKGISGPTVASAAKATPTLGTGVSFTLGTGTLPAVGTGARPSFGTGARPSFGGNRNIGRGGRGSRGRGPTGGANAQEGP